MTQNDIQFIGSTGSQLMQTADGWLKPWTLWNAVPLPQMHSLGAVRSVLFYWTSKQNSHCSHLQSKDARTIPLSASRVRMDHRTRLRSPESSLRNVSVREKITKTYYFPV